MLTASGPEISAVRRGTPVVPGVAYAPVLQVASSLDPAAVARFREQAPSGEDALAAYEEAASAVADGYAVRAGRVEGAAAQVLSASAGLARDRGLRSAVRKQLRAGADVVGAIESAVDTFAALFEQQGGLMAERVTDLRDIERRIVARLAGLAEPGLVLPDHPVVLVAADLAPADTALLDPVTVVALVTERGGATSHTAIIARQLGIPCVVGLPDAVAQLGVGVAVLVDGAAGTVEVAPDAEEAAERVAADLRRRELVASWSGPATTSDGVGVKLLANVADPGSAQVAAAEPVEGVGLFRTELSFLDRPEEPSVAEQADLYAAVFEPFAAQGRHVVVRTLDAGSDKPIAFATHEGEENPALGVRGLRLAADKPDLLTRQLDAIAEAARRTGVDAWVMAPMVATRAEAEDFARLVHERGLKAGAMVEVPAAAVLAHRILEVVDFLSIGTNDLTQYTMAADRGASDLAHLTDPWQPAVLHLVAITAEAGAQAGKPVGVCGEAAADPMLACALVGMGVTSLSMAAGAVRAVGAQLSRVSAEQCEDAAEAVLAAGDPVAAREAARSLLGG